tara:strand:+ start:4120 stop:6597 length:2478 start_codon:yes stop_codon:yes gene_type:complete
MAEDALNLQNLDINKAMNLTSEELKTLGLDKEKIFDIQQKATFATDQALGVGAGSLTGKKVDNKAINEYINKLETPTGQDVYSKQAAMFRAEGEGALLRTQKNLANLFLPTLDLIKKREAAAMARFTLLKNRMPEFDDTTIFGDQSDNPMPIADEIKNISTNTREDLRQLSRLNPMDERYDEIKKRVEKNQKVLVEFDAVNQKLLEIRNSGTDESQWSRGMDATTANMWRDIYTSNGKNIKIVGDKLVWTDERGTTKYKFDTSVEKNRNLSTDLSQMSSFDAQIKNGDFETNKQAKTQTLQTTLNNLGITDDSGNALEVDGVFGPKTQQAYDKYLKQKDSLETTYLDENLSEEDKKRYTITTGVGETRIIDLAQIGDGPSMINNAAVNQDILIRGNAQELINSGVGLNDPMYNTLIKQQIFELNNVGPEGIKSLIFDGLRNDPDSIYNGINTDEFVEQVIRNHYGDDLTESQIEEKIELMRAGDVTQMYNNGKGGQDTLQTQFMEWYKGTIDKQIEEGVKSKLVGGAPTGGGGGGGGGLSTGTQIGGGDYSTVLQNNAINIEYGVRGKKISKIADKSAGGNPLVTGEISMSGSTITDIIKNSGNEDISDKYNLEGDFKLGTDDILYEWDGTEWKKSKINPDSDNGDDVKAYNEIINYINKETDMAIAPTATFDTITLKEFYTSRKTHGYDFDFDRIARQKPNFYANTGIQDPIGDYLLDYRDDDFVAGTLNRQYGKLGFEFEDAGYDKIGVWVKGKKDSTYKIIDTNRISSDDRKKDEQKLINHMKSMYNTHLKSKFETKNKKAVYDREAGMYITYDSDENEYAD